MIKKIFPLLFLCSVLSTQCNSNILLKNGARCSTQLVKNTMLILRLVSLNFTVFFDLAQKSRNPEYNYPDGENLIDRRDRIKFLRSLKLIDEEGNINKEVKDIILSAIMGEGHDLILRNPRK